MKIDLIIEYQIISDRKINKTIDIPKDLEKYISERNPINDDYLWRVIYDYFNDEYDIVITYDQNEELAEESLGVDVDNYEELVEHFSYLIKPKEYCCINERGNYCSTCGKKLR